MAFRLQGRIGDYPTLRQLERQPCPAVTNRSIPTSRNGRPSTSRRATSRAASLKRKRRLAPGRRSTRKPAAATSREAAVTFPIRTFPARRGAGSVARRLRLAHRGAIRLGQEGGRDPEAEQGESRRLTGGQVVEKRVRDAGPDQAISSAAEDAAFTLPGPRGRCLHPPWPPLCKGGKIYVR